MSEIQMHTLWEAYDVGDFSVEQNPNRIIFYTRCHFILIKFAKIFRTIAETVDYVCRSFKTSPCKSVVLPRIHMSNWPIIIEPPRRPRQLSQCGQGANTDEPFKSYISAWVAKSCGLNAHFTRSVNQRSPCSSSMPVFWKSRSGCRKKSRRKALARIAVVSFELVMFSFRMYVRRFRSISVIHRGSSRIVHIQLKKCLATSGRRLFPGVTPS